MIHVLATIEAHPGKRAELLAEFQKLVPLVQAEEGCIEYGPAVEIPSGMSAQTPVRPDVFVVIEKWASLEALAAHGTAPHMVAYRDSTTHLSRKVSLQILQSA